MIIIEDVLISDDIVQKQFLCNLKSCKGACCWEGDFGAPLEKEEIAQLEVDYEQIRPFLTPEGKRMIDTKGKHEYYAEPDFQGTTLLPSGACAYMAYDDLGIAKCGIEQAYRAGATDLIKPISCHLYPIRVLCDEDRLFEALNYDQWEICSAACELGKKERLPVYKFVKVALIRRYGQDFYDQLDAAANHLEM